jgi:hypothetical protein
VSWGMANRRDSRKVALWDDFCHRQAVIADAVPLFNSERGVVQLREYGRDRRNLLERSASMERLVIGEAEKVITDHTRAENRYEGLIYMMFWVARDHVVPLYIGKTEKYGRKGGNLSANIGKIRSNGGKFCRWGYDYRYHIGNLSAVVCPGHPAPRINTNYTRWAERLFQSWPSEAPCLKHETFFWARAWRAGSIGIWSEWGATSLTFLEYLLIGVASDLFPEYLLNSEGVNRR